MSKSRETVKYLRSLPYGSYILTPHWIRVREQVREQSQGVCADCREAVESLNDLDAHHLTYKNLGREQPGDVIAVCRPCHQNRHPRWTDTRRTRKEWAQYHEEKRVAEPEAEYEERQRRETQVSEDPWEWWHDQMAEWADNWPGGDGLHEGLGSSPSHETL